MIILSSLKTGVSRVMRTLNLVLVAWCVNIALALVLAIPMMHLLDSYINATVYEHTLLQQLDQNWWMTLKMDHAGNPLAALLDESVMGYAPFLQHSETLLRGGLAVPIGMFLYDLVVGWTVSTSYLNLLVLVACLGVAVNALLSASFVVTYRGDYPPTVSEFFSLGATHFGMFIRLSGTVLLLQAIIVYPIINGLSVAIARGTAQDASELTAFILYMARNGVAFLLLVFVSVSADYARIRMVAENRVSAVVALVAGMRFVLGHPGRTGGLAGVLVGFTLLLMVVFALIEARISGSGGWSVLLLFVLHQFYVAARQYIRAVTFASEIAVFQNSRIDSF